MSDLAVSLVLRSVPELALKKPLEGGLKSWITKGSFYIQQNQSGEIILNDILISEYASGLAYDFKRFALASLESRVGFHANYISSKAIGWPLLRMYYSAFFAAHAIMRETDQAVIRLDSPQAKYLTEIGQTYIDPSFKVESGNYHVRRKQDTSKTLDVWLVKIQDSRGAHDAFWRIFYKFLAELADEVSLKREPKDLLVVAQINEIQRVLSSNGFSNGTWLSSVRNEINYQHMYGVWFPYGNNKKIASYIGRLSGFNNINIRLDYDARREPLEAFCSGCSFISALNYEVSELLAPKPSGDIRGFARAWRKLIQELKNTA